MKMIVLLKFFWVTVTLQLFDAWIGTNPGLWLKHTPSLASMIGKQCPTCGYWHNT